MNEWISCKDHLPQSDEFRVPCIVTLCENTSGWGFPGEVNFRRYTLPAQFAPMQKIWLFADTECISTHAPVNALLGEEIMQDEDGEDIEYACYVSHWMPYPEPAKEA